MQAPTPLQKGVERFLKLPTEYFKTEIAASYLPKRKLLCDALAAVGFKLSVPEGAYYIFTQYRGVPALSKKEPLEAAMFMITEIGVAPVPGDGARARASYILFRNERKRPSPFGLPLWLSRARKSCVSTAKRLLLLFEQNNRRVLSGRGVWRRVHALHFRSQHRYPYPSSFPYKLHLCANKQAACSFVLFVANKQVCSRRLQ